MLHEILKEQAISMAPQRKDENADSGMIRHRNFQPRPRLTRAETAQSRRIHRRHRTA